MKTTGYYRRRRGVLDHLRDGRMSLLDNSFHDLLCQLADTGTGVAKTSASHLAREFGVSRKLAQKYLCRLERGGYIRRFRKARSKSLQTTLIHRYECTTLPHRGKTLNAWESADFSRFPQLFYRGGIQSGIQRGIQRPAGLLFDLDSKNIRIKPAADPAATDTPARPNHSKDEGEQRRRIVERDKRRAREAEVQREVCVGMGPSDFGAIHHKKVPPVSTAVSTAAFAQAKNRSSETSTPITRAREYAPSEQQANTAVSTAAFAQAKNRSSETSTPITRAREYAPSEQQANKEVSRAAVAAAASTSMSIARARETMTTPIANAPAVSRAGPGVMTPAEIAAEMAQLRAKLASLGT